MKIKGHTSIILTDVNTGEVERHEDENMLTNALQAYFQNCGFLNYPNIDQNNMVVELLGGVLAFDTAITENANTIYAPAGVKMIANGSVDTLNNGNPTELGSFSSTESGWQQDGSYVQTYDYSTSQANGTIACVCLTSKAFGYVGEGNYTSQTKKSTGVNINPYAGDVTEYSGVLGTVFNIDIANSCCHSFQITSEQIQVGDEVTTVYTGHLRKYRLPITKINIKGTRTSPVLLSERTVQVSETMGAATKLMQPHDGKLLIWNYTTRYNDIWGSTFTQYLWTLTSSGTLTETILTNTTGEDILGIGPAIFDGDYCFFPKLYWDATEHRNSISTQKIFVLNRNTDTIGSIDVPIGDIAGYTDPTSSASVLGFILLRGTNTGRIITYNGTRSATKSMVYDAITLTGAPVNASNTIASSGSPNYFHRYFASNLISYNSYYSIKLYRNMSYIASINNLDSPVVKTPDKTMKIVYRISFDEE